ncbi:MAG: type IV toxin-antitoxin system AbiEi family antitoxin domain-containing protein [Actinomycetota bacterium]|nr:type IV toxin-antitoxin system AbiEi family antitoxin domain-containing protein [Actinomycetota bacterium]
MQTAGRSCDGRRDQFDPRLAIERAILELAQAQHWVISLEQLLECGLSPAAVGRRVRQGRLHRIHAGVFAVGRPTLTLEGRWMAAILAGGNGALLSEATAVACYDLSAFPGSSIHITIPRRGGHGRDGIVFHRPRVLHEADIAEHDGFPVTSIARTLLDICATRRAHDVQRCYERAEKLRLLDMNALHEILERCRGHRGIGQLRRLAAYDPTLAARTRSELEMLFLDICRRAELPMPSVNVVVEGFEVDAYWAAAKLVVELDGYAFHSDRAQFERDRLKIARLKVAGIDVVPFTHAQVTREPVWVERTVRKLLEDRQAARVE